VLRRARLCLLSFALITAGGVAAAESASAEEQGQVVIDGTVKDRSGDAVDGVSVKLLVQPTQEQLRGIKVGQRIDLPVIAVTSSDERGRYALNADSGMLRMLRDRSGGKAVNFFVVAGKSSAFSFPREFEVGTRVATARDDDARGPLLAGDAIHKTLVVSASEGDAGNALGAADVSAMACSSVLLQDYGPRVVHIATASNYSGLVDITFTYTQGATSELGVGLSASGQGGTFSQSGTASMSSTATVQFPTVSQSRYDHQFKSMFTYGEFLNICTSGGTATSFHTVQSTGFAGGAMTVNTQENIPNLFCTIYEEGSNFSLDITNAIEYAYGADLAGVIGINLSSKTGYSSTAKVSYNFRGDIYLCGINNYPASQNPGPGRLISIP
jgi:hypothetical protein